MQIRNATQRKQMLLAARRAHEDKIAESVSRELRWAQNRLLLMLRGIQKRGLEKRYVLEDGQDIWDALERRLRARLEELLAQHAELAARIERAWLRRMDERALAIDPEEISSIVVEQLGQRIVGITQTTRREVASVVWAWMNEPGSTVGQLQDSLNHIFSPSRARLIARTEVTRANSTATSVAMSAAAVDEWTWNTLQDELVCTRRMIGPQGQPVAGCRALHGKVFAISDRMPPDGSHPGCRCDPIPRVKRPAPTEPGRPTDPKSVRPEEIRESLIKAVAPRRAEIERQREQLEVLRRRKKEIEALEDVKGISIEEERRLAAERVKLEGEIFDLRVSISRAEESARAESRALLSRPGRKGLRIGVNVTMPEQVKGRETKIRRANKVARQAMEFLELVAGDSLDVGALRLDGVNIIVRTKTRASVSGTTMTVDDFDEARTYIHEMGHVLENVSPAIKQKAIDFLQRRTSAEVERPLSDLTGNPYYGSTEVAKKDRFVDPYMGKIYETSDKRIYATEIVSMGLEMLYTDALKLAQEDPEYFDFIIGVLNG